MQVTISPEELRPVIEAAVAETLARLRDDEAKLADRLAFKEPAAARLLDMEPHQLRDERLRGRIGASSIVGRGIRYTRADLLAYLSANRTEARASIKSGKS